MRPDKHSPLTYAMSYSALAPGAFAPPAAARSRPGHPRLFPGCLRCYRLPLHHQIKTRRSPTSKVCDSRHLDTALTDTRSTTVYTTLQLHTFIMGWFWADSTTAAPVPSASSPHGTRSMAGLTPPVSITTCAHDILVSPFPPTNMSTFLSLAVPCTSTRRAPTP